MAREAWPADVAAIGHRADGFQYLSRKHRETELSKTRSSRISVGAIWRFRFGLNRPEILGPKGHAVANEQPSFKMLSVFSRSNEKYVCFWYPSTRRIGSMISALTSAYEYVVTSSNVSCFKIAISLSESGVGTFDKRPCRSSDRCKSGNAFVMRA